MPCPVPLPPLPKGAMVAGGNRFIADRAGRRDGTTEGGGGIYAAATMKILIRFVPYIRVHL